IGVGGIGAVVQVRDLLAAKGLPDPPAFGVAQVPDQTEQGEVRRWHGPLSQLVGIQPRTLAEQRGSVPVEPVLEHLPLWFVAAGRIILRALDSRCDPGHGGSLKVRPARTPANSGRRRTYLAGAAPVSGADPSCSLATSWRARNSVNDSRRPASRSRPPATNTMAGLRAPLLLFVRGYG